MRPRERGAAIGLGADPGKMARVMLRCIGIEQGMEGEGEICIAGIQRRGRLYERRRDVIEHDDIAVRAAERCFPGDRLFDQPPARLDAFDQGNEVRYDRAVSIVPVVGLFRDAAAPAPLSAYALILA